MDEMSNTLAEMIYYASLATLNQQEMQNCEDSLVGARLGGGSIILVIYMQ